MISMVVQSIKNYTEYEKQRITAQAKMAEEAAERAAAEQELLKVAKAAAQAAKPKSSKKAMKPSDFAFDYRDSKGKQIAPPIPPPLMRRINLEANCIDNCGEMPAIRALIEISK